jgi:hypothetical protein
VSIYVIGTVRSPYPETGTAALIVRLTKASTSKALVNADRHTEGQTGMVLK